MKGRFMSRYEPLAQFLGKRPKKSWRAGFADIENVLGFRLPASAYRHAAWWANQNGPGHSQTSGWRAVGWRTAKVDLDRKEVTFEPEIQNDREATVSANGEFAIRGAIEFLIGLGGTMPDYQPAPRN
jgi:hypothetical protein